MANKKICPVCSRNKNLTVHHILPQAIVAKYKKSDFYKKNESFYVIRDNTYRLCRDCHDECEKLYDVFRNKMIKTLKISNDTVQYTIKVKKLEKIRALSNFLMTGAIHSNNPYKMSKEDALNEIKLFLETNDVTESDLFILGNIRTYSLNPFYKSFGDIMLETYTINVLYDSYKELFDEFLKFKIETNKNEI